LHQAAMNRGDRGPARPLGRLELPEIRFLCGRDPRTRRVPDPFWRQRRDRHADSKRTRGEPRPSHIMNRHQVRWCRSLRAVVSSVGLTGDPQRARAKEPSAPIHSSSGFRIPQTRFAVSVQADSLIGAFEPGPRVLSTTLRQRNGSRTPAQAFRMSALRCRLGRAH